MWSEEIRSYLAEVEGQLAWYQLELLGPVPEAWVLYLGGLALQAGSGTVENLVERLQLSGTVQRRFLSLSGEVADVSEAADPDIPRSQRVRLMEQVTTEALLLGMAGLPMEGRRLVADAAVVAARILVPVTGQQLVSAGVPPGPRVGRTLQLTRDAMIDEVVAPEEALAWAINTATGLGK